MDRNTRGSGGAQALLAQRAEERSQTPQEGIGATDSPFGAMFGAVGGMFEMPLERLRPDPTQPRKHFDQEEIDSFASNLKAVGQIEPIVVRPDTENQGHYIIVVGERRWRAAPAAGLKTLRCILREADAKLVPAIQWSENHFRVSLTPIEEAGGIKAIMEAENLDSTGFAERYKISERTVRRHLQLLKAPVWIQAAIAKGEEVELGEGGKELRRLDLTGAVELERAFNTFVRHEESSVRASKKGINNRDELESTLTAARARAQRKAETVKTRALRENWSRRRWQNYAASVSQQANDNQNVERTARRGKASRWLFDASSTRMLVRVDRIEGSSTADLKRLSGLLSDLLGRVEREMKRAVREAG